jgi:plastocyanin
MMAKRELPRVASPLLRLLPFALLAAGCGAATTSPTGSPGAQSVSVAVQPARIQVNPGQTVAFSAQVYGAEDQRISWRVESGGSVDASGNFTAPATPGVYRVFASSVAASGVSATATVTVTEQTSLPSLPSLALGAFPGCEGSGCKTRGGFASGWKVYLITSLSAGTGPGTLGACIAASGPRVCLFRVSGTINGQFDVTNPYLTIDARSAPGGGIQLSEVGLTGAAALSIDTSDVVVRGLRIRPTYDDARPGDASSNACIRIYNNEADVQRIVVDHNSCEWANGRQIDIYAHATSYASPGEITFSWNIIAEALNAYPGDTSFTIQSRNFVYACGSGGASTSLTACEAKSPQMQNMDLHHNFLASTGYRNPDYRGYSGRLINNLIYNWGLHAFDIAGTVKVDIVGNTFETGPMHDTGQAERHGTSVPLELNTDGNSSDDDWAVGQSAPFYYLAGNVDDLIQTDPGGDNWSSGIATGYGAANASTYRRSSPLPTSSTGTDITVTPAPDARSAVLALSGASQRLDCGGNLVNARDSVDARIVAYEATGGGLAHAPNTETSLGLPGLPSIANVGGTTCPASQRDNARCACADSNGNGIPDYWEKAFCGSATGCDPGGTSVAAPWTNLEAYLSGMVGAP